MNLRYLNGFEISSIHVRTAGNDVIVGYSLVCRPVKLSIDESIFQNIFKYKGKKIDYPNNYSSISFTTTFF